jgi:hypothetical protein
MRKKFLRVTRMAIGWRILAVGAAILYLSCTANKNSSKLETAFANMAKGRSDSSQS